ncbi:two-component system histidine kinase PnpS [Companilactobacillus baiquanensis]|uniref:histidine kinase n=1 Tax=Companilactobacillus baiquanensis TaxID=2486005 RepID=A0ABW1UXV4_9LACO|nr:ATP-binding protein [Companilactobacillus baiquanensis]
MKKKIGPIIAVTVSIVIFIILSAFADSTLGSSQRNTFYDETTSFKELKKNHTAQEAAKISGLTYVDTDKRSSKVEKRVYDLIHKGGLSPSQNFLTDNTFGTRTMYYISDSNKHVVVKEYNRLWSQNASTYVLVALVYLIFTNAIVLFYYKRKQKLSYDIQSVTENLRRVRKNKDMASIILSPDDELYNLVEQTNEISMDINELRDNARLRERRFKSLVGHLPIGVMLLNSQGEVLMHNQAMSALLDVNISNDIHPFIEDVKTYGLSRMIEHTLRKNKNHHKELQLIGNSQKYVEANVIRLVHSREDFDQQILVLLYDLTESRKMDRMQVDFVNNVSHELKTPITSIAGFSETLLNGAKDDPEKLDHFLNIINEESTRLTELIQDILSLSKVQKDDEKAEAVDAKNEIEKTVEHLSQRISKHKISVETSFSGNPEITINREKFNLIVGNLIKNAVSYNKENGDIKIQFNHDEIENRIRFSVEDTGIGIAESEQDRIFERFYRVDRSRSFETGGTGLGLAIVKETIDTLDGDIRIESHKGLGTKFIVHIPL